MPIDLVTVTEESRDARGTTGRAMFAGGAVALAGLLASLALVYTNATGVTDAAEQAHIQQAAESALGAAAAGRNALGQALLLNSGELGNTSMATASVEEASLVLDALQQRLDDVVRAEDPSGTVAAIAPIAISQGKQVLALLSSGNAEEAGTLAIGDATDAFEALTVELVAVRDAAGQAIADASAEAGTVATAARFMVAFFVPAIAVVIVFSAMRRRRRREQLAAALAREREVNRSKDQLIANLSHELRTPLTGIYTSALAIEEIGYAEPDIALELNGMIVDQSADLNRMVEDLLASAQADAGRLAFALGPCAALGEIENVAREMERLGRAITIRARNATVIADAGRLRQLLRNLISNAIRHGGPNVSLLGRPLDGEYVIRVEDDGPGLPPEVEKRLFERFIHEGDQPLIMGSIGLGLAISKVLAEGMNGTIDYQRLDGRTAFELRLPLVDSDPERSGVETRSDQIDDPIGERESVAITRGSDLVAVTPRVGPAVDHDTPTDADAASGSSTANPRKHPGSTPVKPTAASNAATSDAPGKPNPKPPRKRRTTQPGPSKKPTSAASTTGNSGSGASALTPIPLATRRADSDRRDATDPQLTP